MLEWESTSDGVRVTTDLATYEAGRLVLTAGAWEGELTGLPVVAERQVLAWLDPLRPELFAPERFPVFNVIVEEGRYYGFPVFGIPGFKFGRYHHLQEHGDPDELDREPSGRDEQLLRAFAERYFPEGAGPTSSLKACLFENTPDEHFLLGLHPEPRERDRRRRRIGARVQVRERDRRDRRAAGARRVPVPGHRPAVAPALLRLRRRPTVASAGDSTEPR